MRVIIQAGHFSRTSGSTGAPGEADFNWDVANKVAVRLKEFMEVRVVKADPTKEEISGDWDMFLAIHYDADVYGKGGYFVDFADPATDGATAESQRITKAISDVYGKMTGIVNHPERSNLNTRKYYMWAKLSAKTPCVLIECGVGQHKPDDYEILFNNRDLVVNSLVGGILSAFNIQEDNMTDEEKQILEFIKVNKITEGQLREGYGYVKDDTVSKLNKKITDLESSQKDLEIRLDDLDAKFRDKEKSEKKLQTDLSTANETISKFLADLEYYRPYKKRYEDKCNETVDKYTGWQLIKLGVKKLSIKK